jgi:hypothetical protein
MSTTSESSPLLPAQLEIRLPPPVGSVFALGWLMAQLFDGRRRKSASDRQPAFNGTVQLPLVADLDPPDLLTFLVTDLHDLLAPFPPDLDSAVQAEAEKVAPGSAEPFNEVSFNAYVGTLHLSILDSLADDFEQLYAYQLGLALSDMCWLVTVDADADTFISVFRRGQVAAMQTLLNGSGAALPPSSATIVSQSMNKWADWVDVNAPKLRGSAWASSADAVTGSLRMQGSIWHSALTADPEVSLNPAIGAWVQAAVAISRATRTVTLSILRRFWPIVVVGAVVLGGLLYLVISSLSGASQVWASLVTVGAFAGCGGAGLGSGVSRAFGGIGYEVWSAAKLDAQAWNITFLPAVPQTTMQRTQLDNRGVALPRIRKNVDGKQGAARG